MRNLLDRLEKQKQLQDALRRRKMSSLSKKKELNEALIAPGRRGIWEKPLLLLLNAFNYLWFLAWFNCADFYTKPASTSPWGSGTGLTLLFASCLLLIK